MAGVPTKCRPSNWVTRFCVEMRVAVLCGIALLGCLLRSVGRKNRELVEITAKLTLCFEPRTPGPSVVNAGSLLRKSGRIFFITFINLIELPVVVAGGEPKASRTQQLLGFFRTGSRSNLNTSGGLRSTLLKFRPSLLPIYTNSLSNLPVDEKNI